MKCHYCGADVAQGQSYCIWCGTRQEQETAPQEEFIPVETPVEATEPVQPQQEAAPQPESPEVAEEKAQTPEVTEEAALEAFPEIPVQTAPRNRACPPRIQLPTRRGLGKMFFLGILTLGIYPMVIWSRIVTELNIAASRHDGQRTMSYFGMTLLCPITLGIHTFVWMHKFCRRIGEELQRRKLDYKFGAATFWLWNILGSLIVVGPFIFTHKLMRAMNKINADFNIKG